MSVAVQSAVAVSSLEAGMGHLQLDMKSKSREPEKSDTASVDKSKLTADADKAKDNQKSEFDVYDEVEIEDMDYDESLESYFFPCPCGDKFRITKEAIQDGEEIATCPSCSLRIRVIYNAEDFKREESEDDDDEEE